MTRHLGDVLRELREQAGLSMTKLAHRAGVDVASISRIEAHKQHLLSQENLAKVAQTLGVTVEDLERAVGGNSVPPPGWPTLVEWLQRDRNLSEKQRQAILAVYEAYVRR